MMSRLKTLRPSSLGVLLLLASLATAQDKGKTDKTTGTDGDDTASSSSPGTSPGATPESSSKAEALPKGTVKVLKAIVMKIQGIAQARLKPKTKWVKLKVNDVLEPGAVIRTGRKSFVALRIGKNATVLIERQSRIAIPTILQDGDTLKTRLKMQFGKADVKVDRVGLRNDFGVATPTATMAVRGSRTKLIWDPVRGFAIKTSERNRLHAIEVAYANSISALLSGGDGSSQRYQLPAVEAFYKTFILPLLGSFPPAEPGDPRQSGPGNLTESPISALGLPALHGPRGNRKITNVTGGGGGGEGQDP